MGRLEVVLDPDVQVSAADLAKAWNTDDEARSAGTATVEPALLGEFSSLMDLVVIPGGVGLGVNLITAVVAKLIARLRAEPTPAALEIAEMTRANGDRVVVVRLGRLPR